MFNITLDLLLLPSTGIALLPPLLVALAAFRRAVLSRSRHFAGYSLIALMAGIVCQVNAMFLTAAPSAVLMLSSVTVVCFWLEVRVRADQRRRFRAMRPGSKLRTSY